MWKSHHHMPPNSTKMFICLITWSCWHWRGSWSLCVLGPWLNVHVRPNPTLISIFPTGYMNYVHLLYNIGWESIHVHVAKYCCPKCVHFSRWRFRAGSCLGKIRIKKKKKENVHIVHVLIITYHDLLRSRTTDRKLPALESPKVNAVNKSFVFALWNAKSIGQID